ncbi:hypothetical protein ZWY2020_030518, partial [Hordeum vulgare]
MAQRGGSEGAVVALSSRRGSPSSGTTTPTPAATTLTSPPSPSLDNVKLEEVVKGNSRDVVVQVPPMYDLYAMAHTASYKKVKAFSEFDLEHPENLTNISSHHKLVKYRDHGKARKGEDFSPSEGPIDPEL